MGVYTTCNSHLSPCRRIRALSLVLASLSLLTSLSLLLLFHEVGASSFGREIRTFLSKVPRERTFVHALGGACARSRLGLGVGLALLAPLALTSPPTFFTKLSFHPFIVHRLFRFILLEIIPPFDVVCVALPSRWQPSYATN